MSNKNNTIGLNKDKLLQSEYEHYQRIGVPDMSQNWLELFTPVVISDLFTIMQSCSDNQKKAEYICNELSDYGFESLGLGTNVYAMSNPAYPGVAFKIALDTAGLADNYNDEILFDLVNGVLKEHGKRPRYTKCLMRHPTGIVSVQERKVLMATQDRMDEFRGSILNTLRILSEQFLIVDLSPTLYQLNYGIERDGNWCFIDASDLYPLDLIKRKLICTRATGSDKKTGKLIHCGGSLRYSEDYGAIICDRCGKEYIPSEFRPNDKEERSIMAIAMLDGLTPDERKRMETEELAAISKKAYRAVQTNDTARFATVTEPPESDEDEPDKSVEEVTSITQIVPPPPQPQKSVKKDKAQGIAMPPPTRKGIFWNPNDGDIEIDEAALNDRSGGITTVTPGIEPSLAEPSVDMLRQMATSFSKTTSISTSSQDDDEDDEGITEVKTDQPPKPRETITYSILAEDGVNKAILVNIPKGDFDAMYDEEGLGIWVTADGGKNTVTAIDPGALKKLIKTAWEDVLEDM